MLASLYETCSEKRLRCQLCAHSCMLTPGSRGLCGVRENVDGVLHTLVGDNVASVNIDPVEKKPLHHYLPGTTTFSVGTMGCNFACSFCQNANISQHPTLTGQVLGRPATPQDMVHTAQEHSCRSIAFTYNEPTVFFEQMLATAQLATEKGLDCLMVSNGYQSRQCLQALGPHIRAVNIDLKSFSEDFYKTLCRARLAPVLDNLRRMVDLGWWLEVTTLIIPGCNDSPDELGAIAGFIANKLGKHVPWHVTAFYPCFRMQQSTPTPSATLTMAHEIGLARGLSFVYAKETASAKNTSLLSNTRCPACGTDFVSRTGWTVQKHATGNACPSCNAVIPGIWS